MGRKSSIERLAPEVKAHIERRLRENRLTLNELIEDLRAAFPASDDELPSRSALGRHKQSVDEIVKSERESAAIIAAVVGELGEDFDAKSGALMAQTLTTLINRLLRQRLEGNEALEVADVLDLARASKAAQESRSLNLRERQQVAKAAREKLLEEQKGKLEALASKGGVTPQTQAAIREALGIAS